MAEARVARPLYAPWTWRLFEVVPLSPLWTGLLIVAAWFLLYFLVALASGWMGEERFWLDTRDDLYWAVMIGYLPTATAYSLRSAARHLHLLRPVLRCSDAEFEQQLYELPRFDSRALVGLAVVGILLGILIPFTPGFWVAGPPPIGDPHQIWVCLRTAVFSWLVGCTLYAEVATASRFSRIGSRWARIELIDLDQLSPFARTGLRSALVVMGLVVLFSYLFALSGQTFYINVASLLGFIGVAVAALLLPVLGVHRRILAAKRETLERIRDRIRSLGDPTLGMLEPGGDSRLPDLIAYKTLIESVSTWPFDSPTLVRFGLFVSVGVGSWLGGAFVERLLDWSLR